MCLRVPAQVSMLHMSKTLSNFNFEVQCYEDGHSFMLFDSSNTTICLCFLFTLTA